MKRGRLVGGLAASAAVLSAGIVGSATPALASPSPGACPEFTAVEGTNLAVKVCVGLDNGFITNTSSISFAGLPGNWQNLSFSSNIRDDTASNTISSRSYNLTQAANNQAAAPAGSGQVNMIRGHCYHVYIRIWSSSEFENRFLSQVDLNTDDVCA